MKQLKVLLNVLLSFSACTWEIRCLFSKMLFFSIGQKWEMNDHFLTLQTKVDTAGGSLQNPEMGPWLEVWGPAPTPLALDQRR